MAVAMTAPGATREDRGIGRVIAAFAVIYLVWGSTYLAIRYALEMFPPFVLMGVRSLVAGGIFLAWARAAGSGWPRRDAWLAAVPVGLFLFLGGHGALAWGETRVASGAASLIIATMAAWMALFDWGLRGRQPGRYLVVGVVLGLVGVALVTVPAEGLGRASDPVGVTVLLWGSISWAVGSVWSLRGRLPADPRLAAGLPLLVGGVALVALGAASGEPGRMHGPVVWRSVAALGYMILFGSILAFGCFTWLLRVSGPSRVGSYALVNPLVAVLLGVGVADEPLTPRLVIATLVIVSGVWLVHRRPRSATVSTSPLATRVLE